MPADRFPPGAVPIHEIDRGPWNTPSLTDADLSRTERTFGLVGECGACGGKLVLMPLTLEVGEVRCVAGCPPAAVAAAFLKAPLRREAA